MHRWWHATATWRRASAAPPTAWSCGTSSGRRARRHKSWPWRSAISWRLTSETRACLRTSARRWSCSGWPSPPAWSSTMWTCAKSSTWATSSRWPTLTRWWKLVCKVNFSPMTFSAAEKRLYNTIFYFLPWVQIFLIIIIIICCCCCFFAPTSFSPDQSYSQSWSWQDFLMSAKFPEMRKKSIIYFVPLFKMCLLKHTVQKFSPLWCHTKGADGVRHV